VLSVAVVVFVALLSWVWRKTQSVNPEEHGRVDAALRELRSLDRTINQDVVRARYKLVPNYDPVLRSYRRVEDLELTLAHPPRFLNGAGRARLAAVVTAYSAQVTEKQRLIETIKYRTAELNELLDYLPGAGAELAQSIAVVGDGALAESVHHLLEMVLFYNLSSDEQYAPVIGLRLGLISVSAQHATSPVVRRRVRTLALHVQRLLLVKPAVDQMLLRMFDEPIVEHENAVAHVYYAEYFAAERVAKHYRLGLYVLCLGLAMVISVGIRRLRQTARALSASNERLEERVVARTRDLRVVLDNVEEALFTVDIEGRVAGEQSATFGRWFPHARAGLQLSEILAPLDPAAAAWLSVGWDQLAEGMLPVEVALGQLPGAFADAASGRHYRIEYRPVGDGEPPQSVLIVVSDVTAQVQRERRDADQQEHLMLFQHVMTDSAAFQDSFAELERLVQSVTGRKHADRVALARTLHTIKGNASMYGLPSLANLCHELEARGDDTQRDPATEDLDRLSEVWAALAGRVRVLLGMNQADRQATKTDLAQIRDAITTGKSAGELLRALRHIERDSVARRFDRFADQARLMAEHLGKGQIAVRVNANDVRLDGERWAPFWASFVHLLRNALDHGLETPDERRRAGKSDQGHLTLVAREASGMVVIEVGDDGRGIDWDAVRAKAAARGVPADTTAELTTVLLAGGLSTRTEATLYSGRGAGLSACYWACRELGGTMTVTSSLGRGTTLRLDIPGDDAEPASLTSVG
jgi:two-component system chemotaxis sensor kinase CheA